jgi:hypothetical protein
MARGLLLGLRGLGAVDLVGGGGTPARRCDLAGRGPGRLRAGLAGLALFAAAGLGDMAWHLAFGIEQDLAALLSPSHLGLFAGGLHPAFANRGSSDQLRSLGAFPPAQRGYVQDQDIALGVAGIILATVFLLGPVLYLLRRWDLPAGGVLLVAGPQFVLLQALTGFADPELAALGVAGTLAVELLRWWLRPSATAPARLRRFCATAPVALWAVWFGGIALRDGGLGWEPEVWAGALFWSGASLLALAVLTVPAQVPSVQECR